MEGCLECKVVVVSLKEGHMLDHHSCLKDITLFAPIVPLFTKTLKHGDNAGSMGFYILYLKY